MLFGTGEICPNFKLRKGGWSIKKEILRNFSGNRLVMQNQKNKQGRKWESVKKTGVSIG